jgi:hypothetical protein
VQLGSDGTSIAQAPMRLSAGVRYWPEPSLHLELLGGVSPSSRPAIAPELPLYPIEPRVWLHASLGLYLHRPQTRPPPVRLPAPAPPVATGALAGSVRNVAGAPVAGARIEVGEAAAASSELGTFALDELRVRRAGVKVEAEGYLPATLEVEIAPGREIRLDVVLMRALPAGQIRGTVRSLDGTPLVATIRIDPLGLSLQSELDGTFVVDVMPGAYTIGIDAAGYGSQQRPVVVEENGVTVIIVDLGHPPHSLLRLPLSNDRCAELESTAVRPGIVYLTSLS